MLTLSVILLVLIGLGLIIGGIYVLFTVGFGATLLLLVLFVPVIFVVGVLNLLLAPGVLLIILDVVVSIIFIAGVVALIKKIFSK